MKVLIVSTFFPPLNSIASLRPYSWAKYWSLAGHDVTVLTTAKEEDSERSLNFPRDAFRVVEVPMPSIVSRLKRKNHAAEGKKSKKGLLSRFFDYLRFEKGVLNAARMPDFADLWALKAYREITRDAQEWDLIVSTAGPYSVHFIAHQMKKKGLAKRWIADYRDTWSNNYIYPGIFPFNIFERWLERRLLKRADMITTISEPFAEVFRELFPGPLVETIANGFDPEDLDGISHEPIFTRDGKYRIVHTGSIYLGKRDPTPLFQAIQRISRRSEQRFLLDRLEVLFVGPRQANLEELVASYRVEQWVKFSGFVGRSDALRMQRDAHALLFLAWNDPSVDGVLTGKIFEYLFSKTPIWAVGAPELEASQKLILEADAGYAFESADAIERHLIGQLQDGKKENLSFHEHVLSRYNRRTLADKLLEIAKK